MDEHAYLTAAAIFMATAVWVPSGEISRLVRALPEQNVFLSVRPFDLFEFLCGIASSLTVFLFSFGQILCIGFDVCFAFPCHTTPEGWRRSSRNGCGLLVLRSTGIPGHTASGNFSSCKPRGAHYVFSIIGSALRVQEGFLVQVRMH